MSTARLRLRIPALCTSAAVCACVGGVAADGRGLGGEAAIGSAGSLHPAPLRPSLQQSGAALPDLLLLHISDRRDSHPASQTRPPGGRSSSSQQPASQSGPGTLGVMALSSDSSFLKLQEWHRANGGSLRMRDMFEQDKDRFCKFRLAGPCESGCSGVVGGGRDARRLNLHFPSDGARRSLSFFLFCSPSKVTVSFVTAPLSCLSPPPWKASRARLLNPRRAHTCRPLPSFFKKLNLAHLLPKKTAVNGESSPR